MYFDPYLDLDDAAIESATNADTMRYHDEKLSPNAILIAVNTNSWRREISIVSGFARREDAGGEFTEISVVVGMDWKRYDNETEREDAIREHVEKIRENVFYERVPLILIPDSHCGSCNRRIERNFERAYNCSTLREYGRKEPGVKNDARKEKKYAVCVSEMIKNDLVEFSAKWFTDVKDDPIAGRKLFDPPYSREFLSCGSERGFVANRLNEEMRLLRRNESGGSTDEILEHGVDLYTAFAMFCYFSCGYKKDPIDRIDDV